MLRSLLPLAASLVLACAVTPTRAQPSCQSGTLQVFVSNTQQGSCSVVQYADSSYGVTLHRVHDPLFSDPVVFEIRGSTGQEVIASISGDAAEDYYSYSHISIHGPTATDSIRSVGYLTTTGAWWEVDLLRVSEDFGAGTAPGDDSIVVDVANNIRVGRDFVGNAVIGRSNTIGELRLLRVGRDFKGNITIPVGRMYELTAVRDIGGPTPNSPASIRANGFIGRVTGRSIHADITATHEPGNEPDGRVIGLVQTTSGSFTGTLTADAIVSI